VLTQWRGYTVHSDERAGIGEDEIAYIGYSVSKYPGALVASIDLNLMVALHALLQERSVTRAAQRLGLSQPTLSTSLARLRRHYDDQLLRRVGNSYELTPLGERLLEHTEQALATADRVFETRAAFDPLTSDREFTVVAADCHLPLFGRLLADLVAGSAPHVRLRFRHSTTDLVFAAEDQLRTVDAIVLPQGILTGMPTMHLYHDRWVCVVSEGSEPSNSGDELVLRPWVVPYQQPVVALSPMPRLLAQDPRIRAVIATEDFLSIPRLVAGTDRVGLMPERIARVIGPRDGVVLVDPPFTAGHLLESLWWHPLHERDPAHVWLRRQAAAAGAALEDMPNT
jgi:DNA-binding transcriptional LysR family regulator